MLPSPKWPKLTGRMPGTRRSTAAPVTSRNSGMRSSGTVTSNFTLPPAPFWASDRFSRRDSRAAACVSDCAITASPASPASSAAPITSSASRSPASRSATSQSISAYHGWGSANGSRWPGMCASTSSMPKRGMTSNMARCSPTRARSRRRMACSGLSSPTMARCTKAGFGNSLSEAAVMMPSVPSAPRNRRLRS